NGCGIPADVAHRIFDPFFTTKAMGQGTGQGLAISRAIIVEQHKGSLDWTPGDDGGACFSITLPCESDPP
ncbi:ATP-binding protein, partial [Acinetobacter baumannii]